MRWIARLFRHTPPAPRISAAEEAALRAPAVPCWCGSDSAAWCAFAGHYRMRCACGRISDRKRCPCGRPHPAIVKARETAERAPSPAFARALDALEAGPSY